MTKEEAIKRIKDWNLDDDTMEVLTAAIPELKESEDERIRKWIRKELESKYVVDNIVNNEMADKAFAWLKKQGEQTTDKIIERARTEKQRVLLTETNGNAHIDWNCRNLQDVKLLLKYGLEYIDTQIKKQGEQKQNPCEDCNHAMLNCSNFPCEEKKRYNDGQKSADKVEPKFKVGDVIRLKGGAAEYTIRRVTDTTYYTDGWSQSVERCEEDYELVNQNPAWSEEDEKIKYELEVILANTNLFSIFALNYTFSDMISWLKSLKERMQPQNKTKTQIL